MGNFLVEKEVGLLGRRVSLGGGGVEDEAVVGWV